MMKRCLTIILTVLTIMSLTVLTGCGRENKLIGIWQTNEYYIRMSSTLGVNFVDVIIFLEDGTYEEYSCGASSYKKENFDIESDGILENSGTYKLQDNIIEFHDENGGGVYYYEYKDNKIIKDDDVVFYKRKYS